MGPGLFSRGYPPSSLGILSFCYELRELYGQGGGLRDTGGAAWAKGKPRPVTLGKSLPSLVRNSVLPSRGRQETLVSVSPCAARRAGFLRALPARKENKQPPGGLDSGTVSAEGGVGAKGQRPGRGLPARRRRVGGGERPGPERAPYLEVAAEVKAKAKADRMPAPPPAPPLAHPLPPPGCRPVPPPRCPPHARLVLPGSGLLSSSCEFQPAHPATTPPQGRRPQEVPGQPGAKLSLRVCSPSRKAPGRQHPGRFGSAETARHRSPGCNSSKVNYVKEPAFPHVQTAL